MSFLGLNHQVEGITVLPQKSKREKKIILFLVIQVVAGE